MRGRIVDVNYLRNSYAVETDDGDYTVFELLAGQDPEIGDEVEGDLRGLGGEKLHDVTKDCELDVLVENSLLRRNDARRELRSG